VSGERAFVVNARGWPWLGRPLGRWCDLEEAGRFEEVGVELVVLDPGEPNCMYHGESVVEDFLVVSGECVLVIEGEERHLKQWDFVHCPPWTEHAFVGAGGGPCVIVMVSPRDPDGKIVYPVNEVAAKHGASALEETPRPSEAYARFERHDPSPYRDGDLPDLG
jgi:uncharacterized cupin superfamily protein